MTVIHFSKKLIEQHPEIFEHRHQSLFRTWFEYLIDSKLRKAVRLNFWLKEQVDNSAEIVKRIIDKIPSFDSYDKQMLAILRWVIDNIRYIGDFSHWSYEEKWSTAEETLNEKKGDCEDGAILIYVLARLKGVPANRMLLWAGDVKSSLTAPTGGHCSLLYFPEEYPLNPVFVDACYYPTKKEMNQRNKFTLYEKSLIEWKSGNSIWSSYQKTWFIFNEEYTSSRYMPKILKK